MISKLLKQIDIDEFIKITWICLTCIIIAIICLIGHIKELETQKAIEEYRYSVEYFNKNPLEN